MNQIYLRCEKSILKSVAIFNQFEIEVEVGG